MKKLEPGVADNDRKLKEGNRLVCIFAVRDNNRLYETLAVVCRYR